MQKILIKQNNQGVCSDISILGIQEWEGPIKYSGSIVKSTSEVQTLRVH